MSTGYAIPWHLGPLTALDTETTGVNIREDRIVTGYAATVGPAGYRRNRTVGAHVLIDPGVDIPAGATAVHGISTEKAREMGCDPRDGIGSIAQAVADSLNARIPVVGFNLAFDLGMLHYECLRHDLPTVSERMGLPPAQAYGPIIDAHVLDKYVDQFRPGSRKLDDSKGPGVATHYGVPLGDNAHTADADAIAAVRVAVVIAERYPDLPTDPVALHQMQKLWRHDQASSLERHFRTKGGKRDAFVDRCWPFCLDDTHLPA